MSPQIERRDMTLSYRTAELGRASNCDPALVRALQRDLRALGYLQRGIDGVLGNGTRAAIRRLQFDLLYNDGQSASGDGPASVAIKTLNCGVQDVSGVVDPGLADSIEAMLADERMPKLPNHRDPAAANRAVLTRIAGVSGAVAPLPFMFAIFDQESAGEHYAVPTRSADEDSYITLGFDHNGKSIDQVTSRGYGLGQYTIFHHPPRPEEIADFILDPAANVRKAFAELRAKFDGFVVGRTPGTRAEDRLAEHPLLSLRMCRYFPRDARYMRACQACAREAAKIDIDASTPLYVGAPGTYGQAKYYSRVSYLAVPDRAAFQCDWPYAVRRYNGDGPDSYNYQASILRHLLNPLSNIPGAQT